MLTVGIPKEIKRNERRVGLTPDAVSQLLKKGIEVFIEKDAGHLSGFSNDDYKNSGAVVVENAAVLYECAQLIQKVKEPLPDEFDFFTEKHLLFCFLHLASHENEDVLKALLKSKATAVAFETVDENGKLPLLAPMSKIAGGLGGAFGLFFSSQRLAFGGEIVYPANFQDEIQQFSESYPARFKKITGKTVMIFGGGIAGQSAADMVERMGSRAMIVEPNNSQCKELKQKNYHVMASHELHGEVIQSADVLMGCAHSRGKRAVQVLNPDEFASACQAHPKVIIDIAIDQGGNFPEAQTTYYDDPLYADSYSNLRFSVANLPAMAGKAASQALSKAALSYTIELASIGPKACAQNPALKKGLNLERGKIMLNAISEAHPGV